MNIAHKKNLGIAGALLLAMALTRYNHFGSSVTLPDISYAAFFLGGLYLGRVRGAIWTFALLVLEAGSIDFYAINYQAVSGWCVTSAYGFLVIAYAALWYVGRWFAPRHDLTAKGLAGLFGAAAAAGSIAFVIANVSFYLLAGYFGSMGVVEYASRVAQYYGSYVEVTVLYTGCAVAIQMLYALMSGSKHQAVM